jgi:hypothetical protein
MATYRRPGIICQISDWYEDIEDGTLARMPSPLPSTLGAPVPQTPAPQQVVATGDCAFLNPIVPPSTATVRAPQAAFGRLRSTSGAARISTPQPVASQTWPYGSPTPAVAQEITIDGQTIRVIRPTADPAGTNLPTTLQVAEALRAIPAAQRVHTRTIRITPRPHPDSTAPGVHPSRTVAGETVGGTIDLFPVNTAQIQNDFDNRLLHEAGHNYHGSFWFPEHVQAWRAVAAADNNSPSPYASKRTDDDFCEFNILYTTARGTPCEATARQIYPNRWVERVGYP